MDNADASSTYDLFAHLRERSDDAEFFQDLGKTFSDYQLYDLALDAFEISLRIDPCDGFTHLYLGNWYYREGQLEAALERFEYACRLMPDVAASYWSIADVYEALHHYQAAKQWHIRGLAADRSDKQAKRLYRQFLLRRRRTTE